MDKASALIFSLLLLQFACFNRQVGQREIKPGYVCGIEGFTLSPVEHIVNEIKEPIIVRAVKGRLTNKQGGWPQDMPWPILFEVRRMGETAIIQTRADGEGNFDIPSVQEGIYCFKATAPGWQSVMGIIIVKKKASPRNSIRIVMEIGT
jgi:hypothetical protein